MSSGRLILPITEPVLTAAGLVASGATLTVYNTGTTTVSSLYADSGLTTPITNPQTSDASGRFYAQSTVIWADASIAYDAKVAWPDGSTETYSTIYLLGSTPALAAYAPLNSPAFTGTPTAPTPSLADNTTKLATTAYVQGQGYAPLNSPAFTGTPTAPTASPGTNTTQVATTAFVQAAAGSSSGQNAASGYYKLPNGYIRMWGKVTGANLNTPGATASVSFTASGLGGGFPNACWGVNLTPINPGANSTITSLQVSGSLSTTGCTVVGEGYQSGAYTAMTSFYWEAWGY